MITQILVLLIALQTLTVIMIAVAYNNWIVKFIVVGYLTVLANACYFAFDGVKGWPAEEPKEVKGTLASVVIQNPSSSDEGAIYISVYLNGEKKWFEYDYPRLAPKTFYIKYSNNRAEQFQKAKDAMQEGKEVRINGVPPMKGSGEGGEPSSEELANEISEMLSGMLNRLMSKQGDTYKPNVPQDLEIMEGSVPPAKGTSE